MSLSSRGTWEGKVTSCDLGRLFGVEVTSQRPVGHCDHKCVLFGRHNCLKKFFLSQHLRNIRFQPKSILPEGLMTVGRYSVMVLICCRCTFKEISILEGGTDPFIPHCFSNLETKCQKLCIIILALMFSYNAGDEHTPMGM